MEFTYWYGTELILLTARILVIGTEWYRIRNSPNKQSVWDPGGVGTRIKSVHARPMFWFMAFPRPPWLLPLASRRQAQVL